jgi:hypothetical protein
LPQISQIFTDFLATGFLPQILLIFTDFLVAGFVGFVGFLPRILLIFTDCLFFLILTDLILLTICGYLLGIVFLLG